MKNSKIIRNTRIFAYLFITSLAIFGLFLLASCIGQEEEEESTDKGMAILLVDTDRTMGSIDKGIYGQFLEHINHSVIDGLYAEQIRGQGFENDDFDTFWESFADGGEADIADIMFRNGSKSILLKADGGMAGIQQERIYLEKDHQYDGSLWIKPLEGSVDIIARIKDSEDKILSEVPLTISGTEWQEVTFSFLSVRDDEQASIEIRVEGTGSVMIDFVSLMRADVRRNGMLRPDLFQSLDGLKPSFIRWPGGSFASTYRWSDGIGPQVERINHPNEMWGGYSDYYGFGTDEFLELCRQLDADPMIVLSAPGIEPEQVQYAMDWIHYLTDPPTTEWGERRAANGHPDPYVIPYIQIDNEPMNNGFSPEEYAKVVNAYGSEIRRIAPDSKIVACGQKRSNDMIWSQMMIDMAGDNFDILGCHNYEYEEENFQTGIMRIEDYLIKLDKYISGSVHPDIEIAVLEWGLCRTYDWRAGLHAAGSLIAYEKLSPSLTMTSPALLMRNTSDDPTWTAFIYHDHVSWFPGGGYVVEKLFSEHFAEVYYSSTSGTFRDIERRNSFFDNISQMKPEEWKPGTVDAIATGSADGKRIVIKAVNYEDHPNTLLVRLQGESIPEDAEVTLYTIAADLPDAASLDDPEALSPVEMKIKYDRDMTIEMEPWSVVVAEITTD